MREAHLPTQQSQAEEEARLPPPHAHARRTRGPQGPPSARTQAPQRLTWRIRDRATFEALAGARRLRRGPIWLRHLPGEHVERARVAYAIGRNVGNAVTRNRLRRRLRAIVAAAEARREPRARRVPHRRRHRGDDHDLRRARARGARAPRRGTRGELVSDPSPARPTVAARVAALPVRGWRVFSTRMPSHCRFYPSCSAYALEALERHGAARGTLLAVRRIGRCHPWNPGGVDPVPAPRSRPRRCERTFPPLGLRPRPKPL